MLDVDVSRYRDLREKFTPFLCVLHVTKHVCMVSDVVHYVVTRISALSDVTQWEWRASKLMLDAISWDHHQHTQLLGKSSSLAQH